VTGTNAAGSVRSGQPPSPWRLFYVCAVTVLSLVVLAWFLWRPGIEGYGYATVPDLVYGRAWKPYVYRVLLPGTVRLLAAALPDQTRARVSAWLAEQPALGIRALMSGWDQAHLLEYLIAVVLMYLCLCGFLWSLRELLTALYRVAERVRDVFTLVVLAGLPLFFRYHNYPYDFPTLFLFTLGLSLLLRQSWRWFFPVYVLACLNKETTILLTLVFALHFRREQRMSREQFSNLLTAQVVIFVVVKLGLAAVFRDNPGSFVALQGTRHNLDLLGALSLPAVFGWCGVALLLFYRWSEKPLFLRRALWIVVPLVGLTFFLGYLDELRDYYEAYPVVALLLLHSVSRLWGLRITVVGSPQTPRPVQAGERPGPGGDAPDGCPSAGP